MTKNYGPEYVRAIAPYQAGKPIEELAREYGLDPEGIIKLEVLAPTPEQSVQFSKAPDTLRLVQLAPDAAVACMSAGN